MLYRARNTNEMDKLMESFFNGWPLEETTNVYPGLNAWKKDDTIIVKAELPGVNSEDVDISVSGNNLTISGNKKLEELKGAEPHRRERHYGKFSRTLSLPYNADSGKVVAELKDGILSVTIPRAEEDKPRKITIKTN
ncbi:MAG: Hsp20/alpha crystallin family protein [Nitrospinae bacterium]|nr:Hsp20/alpha crystallin family protein [Nitrospinota bacterium]